MYRTCIFCSADLGSNEVFEQFPTGARLAFDSFKGRLWAICPRCQRWNLAPIEERWETVEQAEKLFSDARQRVQSENIGMARMPDGTRLIRVGSALPGELAVWRYGSSIVKRRTRNLIFGVGAGVAGGALVLGLPAIGLAVPFTAVQGVVQWGFILQQRRAQERVVLKLPASESPTGKPMILRRRHLLNSRLTEEGGEIAISLPEPIDTKAPFVRRPEAVLEGPRLWIRGEHARTAAARAMVDYNLHGAKADQVSLAFDLLEKTGSPEEFIRGIARDGVTLARPEVFQSRARPANWISPRAILGSFKGKVIPVEKYGNLLLPGPPRLVHTQALALEMALHEESERRALEGELMMLEEAWREAEEIARIADALPGEPPL